MQMGSVQNRRGKVVKEQYGSLHSHHVENQKSLFVDGRKEDEGKNGF